MFLLPDSNMSPVYARYLHRIYISIGLFFFAISIGTVSYMYLEGYGFVDALYMTVITISTVGFKEVGELSKAGRIFTAFFIIFNIGIFAYVVTNVTSFIVEGEFRTFFRDYNVQKNIQKLTDHVIICGFGRLGRQASDELKKHDKSFIIIENDGEVVSEIRENEELLFVEGDATKDKTLDEARISEAKALITTLPRDADNVFVTLTAREKNKNLRIIARASEEASEDKLRRAGANSVILPEIIAGTYMTSLVDEADIVEFIQLLTGQGGVSISFEEFGYDKLPKEYQNKTIKDLDIRDQTGANIIGIKNPSGEYIINPSPDTVIEPEMKLIILGTHKQRENFKSNLLKN